MKINNVTSAFGLQNTQNTNPKSNINFTNSSVAQNDTLQNNVAFYPLNPSLPVTYSKIGLEKTPFNDDVHLFMLSNGQKVAIMKKPGTTIVKSFVKVGSLNEDDSIKGISHFIEHNLFNGTQNFKPGAIFENTTKMGAYTNASTSFALTDYFISSATMDEKDLEETIKMQSDMIYRPVFTDKMIEKEKGPVTSEISMINDGASSKVFNNSVKNLFNIPSKENDLIAGSIKSVTGLNKDDLQKYWQTYYTPDNVITVVVGDVDVDKTIDLIAKNFNAKPDLTKINDRKPIELVPINSPIRQDAISEKNNFAEIFAHFAGPTGSDNDSALALCIGLNILMGYNGARLDEALNPLNSFCYSSSNRLNSANHSPLLYSIAIEAPKGQTQNALDTLYKTISDLKKNPITQEELQIAKKQLIKGLSSSYENSENICDNIFDSILCDDFHNMPKAIEQVNALTVSDVSNALNKFIDLNKVSLGIVHPMGTTADEIQKDYLRSGFSNKINGNSNISFGKKIDLNTNDIEEYTLKDNTHLILNNSPSDLCYLGWDLVSYDSVPKNLAVPYVLTEMLNSGSIYGNKKQFTNEKMKNGIYTDFDSNGFMIRMDSNCLKENLPQALNMLKESLFNPRFTNEDFERAKTKIATYCNTLNKDAESVLISQLYPDYFPTANEIVRGLNSLTLDDVKKHWNDMVSNSSSNFIATVPFEKNPELKNILFSNVLTPLNFKNKQTKLEQVYKPNTKARVLISQEERNQASVLKNYSFKMSGNIEDEVKFELLNTILGAGSNSRLFQDLRETQLLAYRTNSQIQSFGDTGIITLFITTTTDNKEQNEIKYDNLKKSLDGFEYHTNKLKNELVTQEELESAKKHLKQQVIRECELPYSETSLLSDNALLPFGIKRIDEYFKAIDTITVEDIKEAANYAFKDEPVVSILASKDTINNQMPNLQKIGDTYFAE